MNILYRAHTFYRLNSKIPTLACIKNLKLHYCFSCSKSPVLRHQAMLSGSCSQLEVAAAAVATPDAQRQSCIPEFRLHPSTPPHQGAASASAAGKGQSGSQGSKSLFFLKKAGRSDRAGPRVRGSSRDRPPGLQRSHSEPGLGSSTDMGEADCKR